MGPNVLVGRERELAELHDALANAEASRGGLVVVHGEPGIGKTRVANAFVEAVGSRARFAWGRGWEVGGAPMYWPWIEAFRSLMQQASSDERDAIPPTRLAELAQMDGELAACVRDVPAPPRIEPQQARFRLFDAASALLAYFSERTPVVVILDDLHAADAATVEMLQFVARAIRTRRVLVIATYRDSEARARVEIADSIARLSRESRALGLRRLAESDVVAWLTAVGRPELVAAVYARSEGNPLFVVELLRLADELGDRGLGTIPDGVRDVIRQRLDGLPASTREALQVAAVIGRYVERRLLAHVMGKPTALVDEAVAPAMAARVVGTNAQNNIVFTHVLIQEVLYTEMPRTESARLHGAVADVLVTTASDSVELVHHLFAAIPVRGSGAAIETARRAAADALSHLAFDDAVALLERSLAELPADEPRAERWDLLLELASALFAAGRGSAGRERALDALRVARQLADPQRLARAALLVGAAPRFAVVDPDIVGFLEEALVVLPDEDSPLRARVLARLGAALQPARDFEPPMQIARRGIAMSRRIPADAVTHLEVLHSSTAALGYFADPSERIPLNQELSTVASRLGDKPRALRGQLRLVFDYLEAGDPIQADACIEVCARIAAQLGRPAYQWSIPLVRAMRKVMQGQFAAADELAEEARSIAARSEDSNHETSFTFFRIGLLRAAARHTELAAFLPIALPVIRHFTDVNYGAPCEIGLYARVGAREQTRAAIDAFAQHLPEMRGRMSASWIAEAAAVLDDSALAASLLPILIPVQSRNLVGGVMTMWCEGPATRALGLVAATSGAYDAAERYFESALARVDVLGAPPHRARIEVELAAFLEKRDSGTDRHRARQLLDSARETAVRLGMPELVPETTTAPSVPALVASSFELRPEGEFWTISDGKAAFHLKDSRGLRILALLLASPEREFHVLDLSASPGETQQAEDAGEALDTRAITVYKQRILDLREQLARAEDWADSARATKLREELDALASQLAQGLGLGNRARRVSSNVERARVNVRKRLLDAMTRIGEHSPILSEHLERSIKTGTFCSYHPGTRPVRRS